MLVYEATKDEFMQHVVTGVIVDRIKDAYHSHGLHTGSTSEERSWQNSLRQMHMVLSSSDIPSDSGVAIEFKIPLTGNRIDFMISGYDSDGKSNVVIVELKQWGGKDTSPVENKDAVVQTFLGGGLRETTHPSYQAWSYKKLLEDFNEVIESENIGLLPCAYLHNFENELIDSLACEQYQIYVKRAPLFLREDTIKLRKFISTYVHKGDNKKILYEINNSKIKPSKSLQDSLSSMLRGNSEFTLIDSQKLIFETALDLARKSNEDQKKRVLIVEGGPGTGKSVIAINLLVQFIKDGLTSKYISKNAAPRNVYSNKLKGKKFSSPINHLFSGSGSFTESEINTFQTLIIDEAHRLNKKSGLFKNKGENQIYEVINASLFSVFFIDENQKIDIFDIGSREEIELHANSLDAELYVDILESQFRCNGSDGYLAWIDDVLEIKRTANEDGFDINYDIKVFDSPSEMKEQIFKDNLKNNKSRLLAGYCWNWDKDGRNKSDYFDIVIGDFKMSWNLGNSLTWAIDEKSVNEIGCIHTSQGLEFDYVGLIIGDDMRYDKGIITDFTKRAKTDQSLKGIIKLAKEDLESAKKIADNIIRNTYRTLMTRGQKGCYIYCTDKKLSDYLKSRLS